MSERDTFLLEQILGQQRKQTKLLEQLASNQMALIQALNEDLVDQDPDAAPLTYLDGRPVHG